MTEPYAHLLRRVPQQARSVARVEAILDAAADLLGRHPLEEVTMRDVAAAGGVTVATIYQFLPDKDALVQAVGLRYVAATPRVVDAADGDTWEALLDAVVDGYVAQIAGAPALRALWLAGAMSADTARRADEADDEIAARLRARLTAAAGADPQTGSDAEWRYLVDLLSGQLARAFAHDPAGDPELLAQLHRLARLYAGDVLRSAFT